MTFEEFKNIVHTDLAVIKYSSDDFVKFIRFTLNQVADIIYYTNNPDKLFTIFKQSFVKSFEEKENNNCIIKVVVGNDSNKKVHYFHCQQDDHFKENLDPNDSQYKRLIFIVSVLLWILVLYNVQFSYKYDSTVWWDWEWSYKTMMRLFSL